MTLKLPNGIKSNEIGWLSVWCVKFSVNFGDLPFFMSDDNDNEPNAEGENDGSAEISNNSVNIEPSAKGENGAENFFGSKFLIGLMLLYLVQQNIC